MEKFSALLILTITLQNAIGQSNYFGDNYFDKATFERAKINNEDASKFFSNFHYDFITTSPNGNVLVSFIVRKDGQIDSIQVLNNPDTLWEEIALDALYSSSGQWNAAKFDDKLLEYKYYAGFNFTNSSIFFYKKDKVLRLLKSGQTTKPLKLINEALNINPFDIDLLLWRASIYKKQNKLYLELVDLLTAEKVRTDVLFNVWFQL
jgi:hypothetical protein